MSDLVFEKAFVKAFEHKMQGGKTHLVMVAAMTPQLARALKVHSSVYNTENMPKPEILEVKLNVIREPGFDLHFAVDKIQDAISIPRCIEAREWVATQKGTSKKGKATKLMIQFKVAFAGSELAVFEWLLKYRSSPGVLTLKPGGPQQTTIDDIPAETAREENRKAKGKAAGAGIQ